MESFSYSIAVACQKENLCICNNNLSAWLSDNASNLNGGVRLPPPVLVPLPGPAELLENTRKSDYWAAVYQELVFNGNNRDDTIIPSTINNIQLDYSTNPEVPNIDDNCTDTV